MQEEKERLERETKCFGTLSSSASQKRENEPERVKLPEEAPDRNSGAQLQKPLVLDESKCEPISQARFSSFESMPTSLLQVKKIKAPRPDSLLSEVSERTKGNKAPGHRFSQKSTLNKNSPKDNIKENLTTHTSITVHKIHNSSQMSAKRNGQSKLPAENTNGETCQICPSHITINSEQYSHSRVARKNADVQTQKIDDLSQEDEEEPPLSMVREHQLLQYLRNKSAIKQLNPMSMVNTIRRPSQHMTVYNLQHLPKEAAQIQIKEEVMMPPHMRPTKSWR